MKILYFLSIIYYFYLIVDFTFLYLTSSAVPSSVSFSSPSSQEITAFSGYIAGEQNGNSLNLGTIGSQFIPVGNNYIDFDISYENFTFNTSNTTLYLSIIPSLQYQSNNGQNKGQYVDINIFNSQGALNNYCYYQNSLSSPCTVNNKTYNTSFQIGTNTIFTKLSMSRLNSSQYYALSFLSPSSSIIRTFSLNTVDFQLSQNSTDTNISSGSAIDLAYSPLDSSGVQYLAVIYNQAGTSSSSNIEIFQVSYSSSSGSFSFGSSLQASTVNTTPIALSWYPFISNSQYMYLSILTTDGSNYYVETFQLNITQNTFSLIDSFEISNVSNCFYLGYSKVTNVNLLIVLADLDLIALSYGINQSGVYSITNSSVLNVSNANSITNSVALGSLSSYNNSGPYVLFTLFLTITTISGSTSPAYNTYYFNVSTSSSITAISPCSGSGDCSGLNTSQAAPVTSSNVQSVTLTSVNLSNETVYTF